MNFSNEPENITAKGRSCVNSLSLAPRLKVPLYPRGFLFSQFPVCKL